MKKLNTVLLVEDDKIMRQMLRDVLEGNNFLVLEASIGERSLEILSHHEVDAIIMDLNLPDGCGLGFIKKIRPQTTVPIIVLSGEENTQKKIQSFEVGADDFVSKPFISDLFIARINAHLRRTQDIPSMDIANTNAPDIHLTINGWTLDHMKFQLFDKNGCSADLTSREFKLLDFLISNAGRVIPRTELCEAVCEENYIPTPRALDVKITRLRKKMGDNANDPQIIKTIRGIGYMFNQEVIISSDIS